MKKIYCKYCGLELERGSCNCEQFLRTKNKSVRELKICDTCGKRVDSDAVYCPYCGIPLDVNGNIRSLQKELRGENAPDVLEIYRKEDRRRGVKSSKIRKSKLTGVVITIIVLAMATITFATFLLPIVKEKITNYQLKKELEEAALDDDLRLEPRNARVVEQTTQPVLDLKDMWVEREGYFYALDENGDPVVDDWVTETDENGEEQKYYFDIDGKLVVNSWIDGEYYVGADGAMLRDQDTPDGAHVDEDGRVLLKDGEGVPVTQETYVYYENPNSEETKSASNLRSSTSGNIRGVDPEKTYELYIKNIRQERETIEKGDLRCNIIYYVPIIEGADEKEVKNINAEIEDSFKKFRTELMSIANSEQELPKSIIFNTVEQRTLNSNRMNILAHGRITPRRGLTHKKKFRFVYDRKSKKITITDISE